jgi:acetylornithine deacetylase/succinyl-diaminopimelate desuccinylase-like protein
MMRSLTSTTAVTIAQMLQRRPEKPMSDTVTRTSAIDRAKAYVDDGRFEIELARRVAIKTESQLFPSADALAECHRYLKEEMNPVFAAMGFKTHTYNNPIAGQGPVLLAERIEDPGQPTVLGYGHGDVIRGMEEEWTKGRGPWVIARDGARLYGRGTADNKGQHTLNMAALRAVLDTRGGKLGFNAKFMIEMGEEAGSKGLKELVRAHKADFAADVLIASDGPRVRPDRPTMALGCRGAINFDLVVDLREGGHHSGNWGGLIANTTLLMAPAGAGAADKPTDPQIAHIAYTAGSIDIKAAQQALSISKNETVRAFANNMVADHTAVNVQALALVKKLGVTPEDNATSKTM